MFGLQETIPEPVKMELNEDGTALQVIHSVTSVVPGDYPVMVQLFEQGRQLNTLQTTLEVVEVPQGGPDE